MQGINRNETVQALRQIADKIEKGKIELRSVSSHYYSRDDRSPITTVRVSFAAKQK